MSTLKEKLLKTVTKPVETGKNKITIVGKFSYRANNTR